MQREDDAGSDGQVDGGASARDATGGGGRRSNPGVDAGTGGADGGDRQADGGASARDASVDAGNPSNADAGGAAGGAGGYACTRHEFCGTGANEDCDSMVDEADCETPCDQDSQCPEGFFCGSMLQGMRHCEGCVAADSCGDGYDNDCDGTPDDGCVSCTTAAQCGGGQDCSDGYCADCTNDCLSADCAQPSACEIHGNGCGRCPDFL